MKHILFINGHLNAGGVERSLADILKHMDYTKYAVDLLLLEDVGDYASELPPEKREEILEFLRLTFIRRRRVMRSWLF